MDDIIFIILIFIFFVGPLIKKIFGGEERNRRTKGRIYRPQNNIQEQSSSNKYRPPSTQSINKKYNYKEKYQKKSPKKEEVIKKDSVQLSDFGEYGKDIYDISKSFDKSINEKLAVDSFPDSLHSQKNKDVYIVSEGNDIVKRLMGNEKLTVFQRAMVIHEVFNKPKALDKTF